MDKLTNGYNDMESQLLGAHPIRRYTFVGFLLGLLFPIISWGIDFLLKDLEFSLAGFGDMHRQNPMHFIIDLAPMVLSVTAYFLARRSDRNRRFLESQLLFKEELFRKNLTIAQSLGDKNFSFSSADVHENDRLGNALLEMRKNLIETGKKEEDQNWIARGKEIISDILRHHNNIEVLAFETLVGLIKYISAIQGAFYLYDEERKTLKNIATYAYNRKKYIKQEFRIGEGLIGQVAYEMATIYRREVPNDYVTITSGILGDKKPRTILLEPLISDEKLQGVIEFAFLDDEISAIKIKFVEELSEIIAQTFYNLKVNARTEGLLKSSQKLTEELQENEEELRQRAEEMKLTQKELKETNVNLESQIAEVERGRKRLYSFLENASEVISIYDTGGVVRYESPSAVRILGYDPEQLIGKNAFKLSTSFINLVGKQAFEDLVRNPNQPRSFEIAYRKINGEEVWLEVVGRNLIDNAAINGIIFNTRDITVRKIAEQAQKRSGQMQALSENSLDVIIRINLEGRFYYANPMAENYLGVRVKDVIDNNLGELPLDTEISALFGNMLKDVAETLERKETETVFTTAEGERDMQVSAVPEFSAEKELESILIVSHDITDQKRIEKEIKDKNKAINDSINYAQRIQSSILPDNRMIQQFFPESFIFYKPRDVVSGDFPWFFSRGENIYIAAVDCTGHGVPGAMLSFIAYFLLNNIVDHDKDLSAGEVLNLLHRSVRKTLKQDQAGAHARDGMDVAFCKINKKKKELQYAGAHRPLYFMRNGKLTEYKGTRKAVGGIPSARRKREKDFENYVIKYTDNDKIFFFSDGLPDQVGGEKGRKYQAIRIREGILENKELSMTEFFRYFVRDFNQWKGDNKQIDDVLLIGIEL